jgi:hypothetical protein
MRPLSNTYFFEANLTQVVYLASKQLSRTRPINWTLRETWQGLSVAGTGGIWLSTLMCMGVSGAEGR